MKDVNEIRKEAVKYKMQGLLDKAIIEYKKMILCFYGPPTVPQEPDLCFTSFYYFPQFIRCRHIFSQP